jgi:hypothetical protein
MMTDNDYRNARLRLAYLLGWKFEEREYQGDFCLRPDGSQTRFLPDWTGDNAAAFALMVEHGCYPRISDEFVRVDTNDPDRRARQQLAVVKLANHPSTEHAVRYAIVQAVIAKLEDAQIKAAGI